MKLIPWICVLLICAATTAAHEVRPAYLELRESAGGQIDVLWKAPVRGEMRLSLAPEFSGRNDLVAPIITRQTNDGVVQTWRLRSVDPLRGQTIKIAGLTGTMTDVLLRLEFSNGREWTQRLTPQQPQAVIPVDSSWMETARVYFVLGVEHILTGIDHLMFVLALLIITTGTQKLVSTVTAFTVAHSITLSAATLGFVHVPQAPVEAIIALSIVFVTAEIIHARNGHPGLTERAPWIVAFMFGLLHGFGFAGALSEVGLPNGQIPVALLFFNVGVEAGQLIFIGAVLALIAVFRRIGISLPRWTEPLPAYAIGSLAMFWVIQRVGAF